MPLCVSWFWGRKLICFHPVARWQNAQPIMTLRGGDAICGNQANLFPRATPFWSLGFTTTHTHKKTKTLRIVPIAKVNFFCYCSNYPCAKFRDDKKMPPKWWPNKMKHSTDQMNGLAKWRGIELENDFLATQFSSNFLPSINPSLGLRCRAACLQARKIYLE